MRSIDDPLPSKQVLFLIKFVRLLLSEKLLNMGLFDSMLKHGDIILNRSNNPVFCIAKIYGSRQPLNLNETPQEFE